MRSKRSRTASRVAPPAAQSCRIIAMPSTGRADPVTPRPAVAEARREQRGQRPGQRDRQDRHRQRRSRPAAAASSRRRQARALADQQRRRGDADALAEDAEARVEREGDEEAVGAAVDAEGAEVEQGLDARGEAHRQRRDGHRHAGVGVLLAQVVLMVDGCRDSGRGRRLGCRSGAHDRLTGEGAITLRCVSGDHKKPSWRPVCLG